MCFDYRDDNDDNVNGYDNGNSDGEEKVVGHTSCSWSWSFSGYGNDGLGIGNDYGNDSDNGNSDGEEKVVGDTYLVLMVLVFQWLWQ